MFGNLTNPFRVISPTSTLGSSANGSGLIALVNVLLKASIVVAGLYALFNFIIAGYGFMSAGGDVKNVTKAWEKIWQSILGLIVIAGALLLTMIISYLLFGNAFTIIRPNIYTP